MKQYPTPPPQAVATAAPSAAVGQVVVVQVPPKTALYVQAGAFASLENANRVMRRLKDVDPRISQTVKDGKTLYRVRVGPFQDVALADQTLSHIIALGQEDVAIVIN
jgi:cell division protein FtsN